MLVVLLGDIVVAVKLRNCFDVVCVNQVNLENWILVVTNRDRAKAVEFCKMYSKCATTMGINVAQPFIATVPDDRTESYLREIRLRLNTQVTSHAAAGRCCFADCDPSTSV